MNRWLITFLLLLLCMLVSGRTRKYPQKFLTTTPEKLQLFVNQKTDPYTIKVAYTLNIPPDYIPSCARLIYQPYFLAADHRYDLAPLIISGKRSLRKQRRMRKLTGEQLAYAEAMHLETTGDGMKIKLSQIVPFQVWMAQSKLRADVILEYCNREKHMEVLTLADGVIWFPTGPGPALVKYVKEKVEVPDSSDFYFIYPTGKYVFEKEYQGNAARMQSMMRLVDSLQSNQGMKLEKIVITGYSSPSGNLTSNEWLARKRALQMKQRLVERRKLNPAFIEIRTVGIDWQGLRELVIKDPNIGNKEEIIKILDRKSTSEQRELLIKKLPQYDYLQQHLFPVLQKVACQFFYTQKKEITKVVPL